MTLKNHGKFTITKLFNFLRVGTSILSIKMLHKKGVLLLKNEIKMNGVLGCKSIIMPFGFLGLSVLNSVAMDPDYKRGFGYQDRSTPLVGDDDFLAEQYNFDTDSDASYSSEDSDRSEISQASDELDDSRPNIPSSGNYGNSRSEFKTNTRIEKTKYRKQLNTSSSEDDYQKQGDFLAEKIKTQKKIERESSIAAKDPLLPDGLLSYIKTQKDVRQLIVEVNSDDLIGRVNDSIEDYLKVQKTELRSLFGDQNSPKQPTWNFGEFSKMKAEQERICNTDVLGLDFNKKIIQIMSDLACLHIDKHGMDYCCLELLKLIFQYCSPINPLEEFCQFFHGELSKLHSNVFDSTLLSFDRLANRQGILFKVRGVDVSEIQEICERAPFTCKLILSTSMHEPYQILYDDKSIKNLLTMNASPRKFDPVEVWDLKSKVFIEYAKLVENHLEENKDTYIKRYGQRAIKKSYDILNKMLLSYYEKSCVYIMDIYANRSVPSHIKKKTGGESETQKAFSAFSKSYNYCFYNLLKKDVEGRLQQMQSLEVLVEKSFQDTDILFDKQMSLANISNVVTSGVVTAATIVANGGVNLSTAASVVYGVGSGLLSYWSSGSPASTTQTATTSKSWF